MENILSQFELPKDTQGNFKAKCRHCPAFISGSLKITSNFNTHIKVSKNMKILINSYVLIYIFLIVGLSINEKIKHIIMQILDKFDLNFMIHLFINFMSPS